MSILAQIPAAAVTSVTLDLIGHAAQGEYRQIGASTNPAAVAALAQLQQLAHPMTDAITAAPQPAWLTSAASAADLASDASAVNPAGPVDPAELPNPASTADPTKLPNPASTADPTKLSTYLVSFIDPPLLY